MWSQAWLRENRALHGLAIGTLIAMGLSAYRPAMVFDWWLENLLAMTFLGILVGTYRRLVLPGIGDPVINSQDQTADSSATARLS